MEHDQFIVLKDNAEFWSCDFIVKGALEAAFNIHHPNSKASTPNLKMCAHVGILVPRVIFWMISVRGKYEWL